MKINGRDYALPANYRELPLVHFLRDHLGLTGTKFGCGKGHCGACTIHLDGQAVRSCQTLTSEVEEGQVVTIEGLAFQTNGVLTLHPIQEAWLAEKVAQCGYCQPGQIMSAAALLSEHAKPDDQQITEAMNGNLCRCGSYDRIRKAIHRAAGEMSNG